MFRDFTKAVLSRLNEDPPPPPGCAPRLEFKSEPFKWKIINFQLEMGPLPHWDLDEPGDAKPARLFNPAISTMFNILFGRIQ